MYFNAVCLNNLFFFKIFLKDIQNHRSSWSPENQIIKSTFWAHNQFKAKFYVLKNSWLHLTMSFDISVLLTCIFSRFHFKFLKMVWVPVFQISAKLFQIFVFTSLKYCFERIWTNIGIGSGLVEQTGRFLNFWGIKKIKGSDQWKNIFED